MNILKLDYILYMWYFILYLNMRCDIINNKILVYYYHILFVYLIGILRHSFETLCNTKHHSLKNLRNAVKSLQITKRFRCLFLTSSEWHNMHSIITAEPPSDEIRDEWIFHCWHGAKLIWQQYPRSAFAGCSTTLNLDPHRTGPIPKPVCTFRNCPFHRQFHSRRDANGKTPEHDLLFSFADPFIHQISRLRVNVTLVNVSSDGDQVPSVVYANNGWSINHKCDWIKNRCTDSKNCKKSIIRQLCVARLKEIAFL